MPKTTLVTEKESTEDECFRFVQGKTWGWGWGVENGWEGKYSYLCIPQAGMTTVPVNPPCPSFRRKICIIPIFSVLNIKLKKRFHFFLKNPS